MPNRNKKNNSNNQQQADSPAKQAVEVVYPSDSSSNSSGSTTTAKIYADSDSIMSTPQKNVSEANQPLKDSNQVSSGASVLANSINLKFDQTKRSKEDVDEISLKDYLRNCYQSMTGEVINDAVSTEDMLDLITSSSNDQYSSEADFKNRMAFLERVFRTEVDIPVPESFNGKEYRSKGYPLLLTQSFIILQVCKRLRSSFDMVEWLQGLEFIQNIAELNCLIVKLGATSGGFEAAKELVNSYKSGGSIDDLTSKRQEKAIKKGEKLKEEKQPVKKSGFFQKRRRTNTFNPYRPYNSSYNDQQPHSHHQDRRGFTGQGSNSRNSNRIRLQPMEKLPPKEVLFKRESMDKERDRFHAEKPDNNTISKSSTESYKRSAKERIRRISIHSRLKKDKRWNNYRLLQDGINSKGYEIHKERNVGLQARFKKGIFSGSSKKSTQDLVRVYLRRKNVPFSMPSIWFKHSTSVVHKNNERNNQEVEIELDNNIHLYRRHAYIRLFPTRGLRKTPNNTLRSENFRLACPGREIYFNTHPINRLPRATLRFGQWKSTNSIRKATNSSRYNGKIDFRRVTKILFPNKICSKIHRKNGILGFSRSSNTAISRSLKKANDIKSRLKRLELNDVDKSGSSQRFEKIKKNYPVFKRFMARSQRPKFCNYQFRCVLNRFCHPFKGDNYNRKVQHRIIDQRKRIDSNLSILQRSKPSEIVSQGNLLRNKRGQLGCSFLRSQRLRSSQSFIRNCKRHLDYFNRRRLAHQQSGLHSLKRKQDSRQIKQIRRLEIFSRIDRFGRRRIRSPYSRPIRKFRLCRDNNIQQLDRKRCIRSTLGEGLIELLRSSFRTNPTSSVSPNQIESEGNFCGPGLADFSLVPDTITDILKSQKSSKKNAYRRSIHRIVQQIREPNIPGSSSERRTILSMRNLGLSISLSVATIQKYSRVYGAFQWFLLIHNIPRSNPYAIECFAAYLSINKKGYDLNNLKPALQFFADIEGWKLNVPSSFARVKKGLLRAYFIVDRNKLKRNGISAFDIKNYIDSISSHDEFTFNLTSAILVIGFRLLARPGDLCNLSWYSIKVDYPKENWITFDLSGHKTDFFMIDDPTPIEPLKKGQNVKYCPSAILKRYINMVKHFKTPDSPLFSWSDDLYLETSDLSNIIKNAMSFIGVSNTSGHSLRIGAATELASKGVSELIIDTAGNWAKNSKSKKRYIRRVGLASIGLSTTLLN